MKAVRYVGEQRGLPREYMQSLLPQDDCVVVDSLPHGGNVTVRAKLDGKAVQLKIDPLTRDFLDLATLVYIADEVSEREKAPDYWSRDFEVVAPVAAPSVWEKNSGALSQMLRTLSGDNYTFRWSKRPGLKGFGEHRISVPSGYDSVCLFSGGIDSFLGAFHLLSQGQRVLLVGHQADPTAASAQTDLARVLKVKFPGMARLVQFRVARSRVHEFRYLLPDKVEETHRPRSLLFLALAITIANSVDVEDVYIPENGLIALNPPLGKSRLGTLSTRTAHPRYLTELADFLQDTEIFEGRIKNPFLFMSKTDMLRGLDSSLFPAMRRSVSCARPSRYKDLGVRHCGYCMPCIYKRIAMAEINIDRSGEYAFDVFKKLNTIDTSKQLDFRALVAFAKNFLSAGRPLRELIVLAHGTFPLAAGERFGDSPTESYEVWSEMIERWAEDFLAKLRTITSAATRKIVGL